MKERVIADEKMSRGTRVNTSAREDRRRDQKYHHWDLPHYTSSVTVLDGGC
jgi:hypothetical protein